MKFNFLLALIIFIANNTVTFAKGYKYQFNKNNLNKASTQEHITLEACLKKEAKANDYFFRLNKIEYSFIDKNEKLYEEYSNLLSEIKEIFYSYQEADFNILSEEDKKNYLNSIQLIAVIYGKMADVVDSDLTALTFAKKAKKYCDKYQFYSSNNFIINLTLAVLYYKVPGFPISFGDNEKAKELFNFCTKSCKKESNKGCLKFVYENKYIEYLIEFDKKKEALHLLNETMQIKPKSCNELLQKEMMKVYYKKYLH